MAILRAHGGDDRSETAVERELALKTRSGARSSPGWRRSPPAACAAAATERAWRPRVPTPAASPAPSDAPRAVPATPTTSAAVVRARHSSRPGTATASRCPTVDRDRDAGQRRPPSGRAGRRHVPRAAGPDPERGRRATGGRHDHRWLTCAIGPAHHGRPRDPGRVDGAAGSCRHDGPPDPLPPPHRPVRHPLPERGARRRRHGADRSMESTARRRRADEAVFRSLLDEPDAHMTWQPRRTGPDR